MVLKNLSSEQSKEVCWHLEESLEKIVPSDDTYVFQYDPEKKNHKSQMLKSRPWDQKEYKDQNCADLLSISKELSITNLFLQCVQHSILPSIFMTVY
jgi:hypothetical protein